MKINESKLELKVEEFLKLNKIKYERHVPFTYWESQKEYKLFNIRDNKKRQLPALKGTIDFYIPKWKLHLEIKGFSRWANQAFAYKKRLIKDKVYCYEVVYNWKQFMLIYEEFSKKKVK